MRNNRRFFTVLFVMCLALSLFVACSDDDDDDDNDDASPIDDDNDASPANDDDDNDNDNDNDDDTSPADDDDDDTLACESVVERLFACGEPIFDGEDTFTETEALADCQSNSLYDQATWKCIAACADRLETDCANSLEEITCVPFCLYYGGPVPDDCPPLYPDAQVCGHRGASMYAPANTIPAYEAAIAQGADFIEVDVQCTLDGYLVCLHDSDVSTTTNGEGLVEELTLEEIRALEVDDSDFNDAFPGLQVPTFAEALAVAKDRVIVDIDGKTDRTDLIITAVQEAGMTEQVIAYCGSQGEIESYLAVDPDFPVMPAPDNADDVLLFLELYEPEYVEITNGSNDPASIAAIHAAGALVFMDALGTGDLGIYFGVLDGWLTMLEMGIDIIQTDMTHAVVAVVENICQ